MVSDVDRLIRYRNYAEELRIIAGDRTTPHNHEALLRIAEDYDRLANSVEAVIKSKDAAKGV
jgi:hypothetical protein